MSVVTDVVASRMKLLQGENPGLVFEDDHMDTEAGGRGLIRAMDREGNIIALEFAEPEALWADPDAVEEYAETMADGIAVIVIVPPAEKEDAEETIHREAGKSIVVLGYDEIGSGLQYH